MIAKKDKIKTSLRLGFMIPFKVNTSNNIFLFLSLTLALFVTFLDCITDKPKLITWMVPTLKKLSNASQLLKSVSIRSLLEKKKLMLSQLC